MRELGEVVLVYYEDKPAVYGRIEAIEPDVKKDWYHLTLLLLTIPTQVVTWILREAYIDGEPFTMGGRPMRLEGVERVGPPRRREEPRSDRESGGAGGRVIPFRRPEGR
ncbi:MAG: hypothetical protein JRF59_03635 [Deltaproteobacteria bacterium]|nr:hypothetical protein [Deltaproteobacteria bacterium]MBW1921846.1 hypothetical protein [Deltaproteobacteria bacterium]MBW1948009.1 hypothetical protein [Deltaproteobacteria bacterium]MBW2346920.1 hypothetical protein [Deltaproteobacteria bacterium]RLB37801.1 MAG: hypothetical protein DRH20_07045 [Deltaproteobacteria bacterium]